MTAYTRAEIVNGTGWDRRTRFLPITLDEHEPIGEYRPAYNGWPNRETWNASLWINNEEPYYLAARDTIRRAMDGSDWDSRGIRETTEERRYQLTVAAEALRRWYDETFGPRQRVHPGPVMDAWTYTVACIDWYRVTEGLAEDMPSAPAR